MQEVSRKRHIAKTLTWRIVATLDTVLLSWLITGNPITGVKIGAFEVITKMVLYYFHERVWLKILIGNSRKRHITKTFTWRFVGTLDTMVLSWLITGNPLTGVKIGLAEVITKMLLYYLHERIWYHIDYGLSSRNKMIDE